MVAWLSWATFIKINQMEKIAYTIEPAERPTQDAWFAEFRIGLMAKPRQNDRPKKMMDLWKDKNGNVDFTHTIQKLKP